MTGALTDDQPARVVRFENRDDTANPNLEGRDGQAEQGAKQKRAKTDKEDRTERLLKNAYWLIFCCGLCEEWDLAAESQRHGALNTGLRGGERRQYAA